VVDGAGVSERACAAAEIDRHPADRVDRQSLGPGSAGPNGCEHEHRFGDVAQLLPTSLAQLDVP
jgi:hypothetical protein